ncbi:hypothetical protein R3P38DRAFT_2889857 [Favolaschia claudopus]|uniref:Uncharacterized protein n=1 Tax=Favolaschia claudopus TaxID=2862362 RepID=A0AAW0CT83_9AGAR
MAIPSSRSSRIIDLATSLHDTDESCIRRRVRERLEWTWGLGYDHLDEHLQQFSDPQGFLTDDAILVFPQSHVVEELSCRDDRGEKCVRRPYIQKLYNGRCSFEYILVAIDPASSFSYRVVNSEVPPHLALCTTFGKIMKAWGLHQRQLMLMEYIYRKLFWVDVVPSSFLSFDSDQTMVEPADNYEDESQHLQGRRKCPSNVEWDALSSASLCEPKRRLLSEELARSLNDSDDHADDDSNASSVDSYLSRDEVDSDVYEADRRWLEGIQS